MKLVIDCFKLVKGAGKSIGIYNLALNLVRELARKDMAAGHEIIVLGNAYNRADFEINGITFREIHHNPLNKITCIMWELFEVSILAKRLGADRVLFPRGYASMLHLTSECVIIHDMIPFFYHEHYPGYFNRLENFYIMWRLKASARSAEDVITISEASKRDIMKYAHTDEQRIHVIHNGYNAISERVYQKPASDYIIAVTSNLPHKNAEGIVRTYEAYCNRTEAPLPLTIIGIEDVSAYHLSDRIARGITCIRYVEKNEELHQLIYGAKVFLFLSLIEGFGFPPIEAMQLDTPVICSGISSLPEVVGEAAVCVDPTDYEKAAEALIQVLGSAEKVKELCEKGKKNVERFHWQKTGEKYREVLFG